MDKYTLEKERIIRRLSINKYRIFNITICSKENRLVKLMFDYNILDISEIFSFYYK